MHVSAKYEAYSAMKVAWKKTRSCHKQRQTVSQSPPIKQQALPLHLMVPVSVFLPSSKH